MTSRTSRTVAAIARQELLVTVRNRWTLLFAVIFGVLVTGISYFGTMTEGFSGMQSFSRTTVSILNLVLYIIPLVALTMGTLSFSGDKGSMEMLFAQPIARGEILLGKYLGLVASIALSTLAGFAAAGIIIVERNGSEGLLSYTAFVLLSLMLSLAFLSLSLLIAIGSKRKAKAFGVALFCWFFFVLFYDLAVLGCSTLLSGKAANMVLFLSLFGNPVDMVRVGALIMLNNAAIFGAAGAALVRFLGGEATGMLLLGAALIGWAVIPFLFALRTIHRQDL